MKLTCAQMDVLISFYIEGDLSKSLKLQVENHLKNCAACRAKYDIIKSMIFDLKVCLDDDYPYKTSTNSVYKPTSQQYRVFKNNISAYLDNELTPEENIKIKKFAINNKDARKDLEDSYNIRRLMKDSYQKCKTESKQDFSKSVLKHLEIDDIDEFTFNPAVKITVIFCLFAIIVTSIILLILSC